MNNDDINLKQTTKDLTEVFHAYELALMSNDLAALDAFFWDDMALRTANWVSMNFEAFAKKHLHQISLGNLKIYVFIPLGLIWGPHKLNSFAQTQICVDFKLKLGVLLFSVQ